jgi:hypothetical protein
MAPRRATPNAPLLAAVSAAQLGAGLLGLIVALRRRHAYDFLFLHGSADHVARDALFMGTALSAPAPMLLAQAVATARLVRSTRRRGEVVLGTLGATMVAGYLGEALVRRRLQRSGFDPLESPLAVVGVTLAGAMALLGLRGRAPDSAWRSGRRVTDLPRGVRRGFGTSTDSH